MDIKCESKRTIKLEIPLHKILLFLSWYDDVFFEEMKVCKDTLADIRFCVKDPGIKWGIKLAQNSGVPPTIDRL